MSAFDYIEVKLCRLPTLRKGPHLLGDHFFLNNCIVPMEFLPWENGWPSPGKASSDSVALPNLWCMLGALCFHNPPSFDMDYGIFNVRTDVHACDCTWGCTDTVRESALKVDSGRKIPCRTEESPLRRRRAGPMLYQPSYIPTLMGFSVVPRSLPFPIFFFFLTIAH